MGSSSPSLVSAHVADANSTGIYVIHHPGADIARVLKYSLCGVSGMFTRAFKRARHTRTEMRPRKQYIAAALDLNFSYALSVPLKQRFYGRCFHLPRSSSWRKHVLAQQADGLIHTPQMTV
jgi:hypothetical protein